MAEKFKEKNYKDYQKTRFNFDKNRIIVWKEITKYLQKYICKDSAVLDLGSGYCDFINSITARKKYALDKYINPKIYAFQEVEGLFGDYSLMNKKIKDDSLDIVFASNFLEHLNQEDTEKCINMIYKKLKINGLFIIIQPNYKFSYKDYFDDYTHITTWSDIGLKDYLISKNFQICLCKPRFLPFSMKSKIPKNKLLIRIYLKSPVKPFAKQMLIITKKN